MTSFHRIKPRRFKSIDEIRALPGFTENQPITTDNYSGQLGHYVLPEWVKCCFCKVNLHLCRQDHKSGFVVLLKDGTISLIGCCCGKENFPEGSHFHADSARTLNELRRTDRLTSLAELVKTRAENEIQVLEGIKRLNGALKAMQAFKITLGEATAKAVERRVKEGRLTVFVDAINYKRWTDHNGQQQQSKDVRPYKVGTLLHAQLYSDRTYQSLKQSLNSIKSAYGQAEKLLQVDPKQTEIDSVARIINELPNTLKQIAVLESNWAAWSASDLTPLLYLVGKQSERYKAARAILQLRDPSIGKDAAKDWLSQLDSSLKNDACCETLKIQD